MSVEIIAHRGYSARAPENTLSALERALEVGATALEWDIQRSADGVPMVFHDETLERTTNGQGRVDARPAAALGRLDAGSWFAPEFAGEPVPTLGAVLDAVGRRARRLYPEIKRGASPAEVDRILAEVEGRGLIARTVFISMDWDALDRIQARSPQAWVGYIVEAAERYAPALAHVRERPRALLDPDWRIVLSEAALTGQVRAAGVPLAVWTVNDPADAERLAAAGVTRFTTNEVERLLDWAARRTPEGAASR